MSTSSESSNSNLQALSMEALQNFLNQSLNMSTVEITDEQNAEVNLIQQINALEHNFNTVASENVNLKKQVSELQDDISEIWDSIYYTQRDLGQF